MWAQLIWLLDICLCLQKHIKMFFSPFSQVVKLLFFPQPGQHPTSKRGKDIRLFIILFGGSVCLGKKNQISWHKSRGHKSIFPLVAKQSVLIIFCYGSKQTGLLSSPPDTQDWILMRPILELRTRLSHSVPPLSFLLVWTQTGISGSYCRQVRRPQCLCQKAFAEAQAQSGVHKTDFHRPAK